MSLHIYTSKEQIPENVKYIKINDAYFDVRTDIPDSELSRKILKEIDKAEYVNDKVFKGRTEAFGNLDKSMLSTGTKTLFNIIMHPKVCFDVLECGVNALNNLPYIQEGHILWEYPMTFPDESAIPCDIICDDKHYSEFFDFLRVMRYGEDGDM